MWLYNLIVRMYNGDGYTNINDTSENETNIIQVEENVKTFTSVGIQTDIQSSIGYTSFNLNDADLEIDQDVFFKHLEFANQTYWQHFKDSMKYSFTSFRASFYFFCHAFWPDIFTQTGSETVHELSSIIYEKYLKRINEIKESRQNQI